MQWGNLTVSAFAEAVRKTGVCVIAMGVLEKHSEHLPLETDFLNAHKIACLADPAFHLGCWMSRGTRGTQPGQVESMRVIETVLQGYLDGEVADACCAQYPYAVDFIRRAYNWLGPVDELADVQKLLIQRMLLPFEFFLNVYTLS